MLWENNRLQRDAAETLEVARSDLLKRLQRHGVKDVSGLEMLSCLFVVFNLGFLIWFSHDV